MLKIKVSSKRQATFPKQVCESLGVKPGDDIFLDRRIEDNEEFWILKPGTRPERPWFRSLQGYASGKDHDMSSIRESIARHRGSEFP